MSMIQKVVGGFLRGRPAGVYLLVRGFQRALDAREAREAEARALENTKRNTFFSVLGTAQRRADALRAETLNAELAQGPAAPEEVRVETGNQQANIAARRRRSGGVRTPSRI